MFSIVHFWLLPLTRVPWIQALVNETNFFPSTKKLKLEVNKLQQQTKILEEQIKPQKVLVEKVKPDPVKVKEMQEKVDGLRTSYDEVMERSRETKESVKKLNIRIKEVGSNKVKSARNKLDNIKSQFGKVRKEITHLKVGIQSALRDFQKSKNKSENLLG